MGAMRSPEVIACIHAFFSELSRSSMFKQPRRAPSAVPIPDLSLDRRREAAGQVTVAAGGPAWLLITRQTDGFLPPSSAACHGKDHRNRRTAPLPGRCR
jgi:hypothetical protein